MHKVVFDSIQVVIFSACLIMTLSFGKNHFHHNLGKLKILVWGLVLLSAVAAFRLILNFKSPTSLGISHEAVRYVSAFIIFGYLSGGCLVLGGLGGWIVSLFKSHKIALTRLKQLTCFKSLLSIANHFRDPDQILKESLANFMLIMGYKKGVIFRSSFRSGDMKLVAYWGFSIERIHQLHNLSTINPFYLEARKSKEVMVIDQTRKLPEYNQLFSGEDKIGRFVCVPLKYRNRICGVMGIYDSKEKEFTYQETQFLSNWGNMLGVVVEEMIGSRRNKLRRDYLNAAEEICELAKSNSSFDDVFPAVARAIQKVVDFTCLCLSLVDKSGENMRRLTIGAGGNLFLDKGVTSPTRGTLVEYVVQTGEALLDDDVWGDSKFIEDDLLKAMEIRSRLIVPLKLGKRVCATLTLGHMKHSYYALPDVKWLNLISGLLSVLVLKEQTNLEVRKRRQYSVCLNEIVHGIAEDERIDDIFSNTASLITQGLPTTFCRIALLDNKEKKLDTKALSQIRNKGVDLSVGREHWLTELPWHRLALESKQLMLVNQDDPESIMSANECRQIMTDHLRSALLVPLVVDGESLGIMSLGEERSWQRRPFDVEDVEFAKKVAACLSIAIRNFCLVGLDRISKRRIEQAEGITLQCGGMKNSDELISNLNYNLNDPLCSIIGSAELVFLKTQQSNPEIAKYAKIIERNANRIHQAITSLNISVSKAKPPSLKEKSVKEDKFAVFN